MAEKKVKKRKGIKNVRKTKRRHARNLQEKKTLKSALKAARTALKNTAADVMEKVKKAISIIDKAAERKLIHRNKSSRLKGRLMQAIHKLQGSAKA